MPLSTSTVPAVATTNEGPWTTPSFTPAANERLYIVFGAISANAASAVLTVTDTQGNAWQRKHSGSFGNAQAIVFECVSTCIARSMQVTVSSNLSLGGAAFQVIRVAGYGKLRQAKSFGIQIATQPVPAVAFTNAPLAASSIVAFLVNVNSGSTANVTPPSGFNETADTGYTSPNVGFEVALKDGGAAQTITWGSSSPANYLATVVEIEPASLADMDHFIQYGSDATYNVLRIYQPLANPWNVINAAGERPICLSTPGNAWSLNGGDAAPTNHPVWETRYYGCAVVYVQYRKRESTTWPTPLQDMHAGTQWMVANAATYKLDLTRVCGCGNSAAASNAAFLALSGGSAAVGGTNTPVGLVRSVLWFFGQNRSRLVDPAYTAIGISRGIPNACSTGSPEQEVFDAIPCSMASFDWLPGDGGSLDDTSAAIYNLFTPGWWASKYPGGSPKPSFELWHGTNDTQIPYFCSSNPKTMGTGHALDNGFHQDLIAHGFTSTYVELAGAGHGGSQFLPSRIPGATNGAAVDAAIVRMLNAAGVVNTPIVVPTYTGEVTLNGRRYVADDFVGEDRRGYAELFPEPFCDDAVAQWDGHHGLLQANTAAQNTLYDVRYRQLGLGRLRSHSSLSVGTGARTFTLTAATDLNQGFYVAYSEAAPANRMFVRLAADLEASATFAVTADIAVGSGTFSDWIITPLADKLRWGYSLKTSGYTIAASDNMAVHECTGTFTVLGAPAANAGVGYTLMLVNTGAGTVTFDPFSTELVNNASTLVLAPGEAVTLVCTGTGWRGVHSRAAPHDIVSAHTESGLTAGWVMRALTATTFGFGALATTDLPAEAQRAIRSLRVH